jgi:hypothetical protein
MLSQFKYFAIQALIQFMGLWAGLLIVQALPKEEYAIYAISTSILAALVLISESGSNSVLLKEGAKSILEKNGSGSIFQTGFIYRIKLGFVVGVLGCLYLFLMLRANEVSIATALIVVTIVLATFIPTYANSILIVFHRLNLRIDLIQRVTLVQNALRVLLVFGLILASVHNSLSFLALNLILLSASFLLYRAVPETPKLYRARSGDFNGLFKAATRRVLPMTLLMVAGEQAFTLLLSVKGSPQVVAEASALIKFGIVLVVLNSWVADRSSPKLARYTGSRKSVLGMLLKVLAQHLTASSFFVTTVFLFRDFLCSLLGVNYRFLQDELVIFTFGSALFYLGFAWDTLNQSRGWIRGSWIFIPSVTAWFVFSWLSADVTSVAGAGLPYILLALPMLITQLYRTSVGFRKS